ncbi:MAG: (2Fe-2S) ferredoxin domain-containing protein [Bacteroidia bacterium]
MLHVLICNSQNPKQLEVGCCGEKNADSLLEEVEKRIEALGLQEKVQVKTSPCMRNCASGITVKIIPGNLLLGNLDSEDAEILLKNFILKRIPQE